MIHPEPLTCRPVRGERPAARATLSIGAQAGNTRVQRQFHRVAETVVKEFPASSGGTILFSGAGSSGHVADVALQVALHLAQEQDVAVSVVDGDFENQTLTQRLSAGGENGLAEILQQQESLAAVLATTEIPNVRFLAFGDQRIARNPIASDLVKLTLADLRNMGRYTIIAAGTTFNSLHALLGRHADGTYLVVQLGAADSCRTTELARHLTRAGARLLGCIATGVS